MWAWVWGNGVDSARGFSVMGRALHDSESTPFYSSLSKGLPTMAAYPPLCVLKGQSQELMKTRNCCISKRLSQGLSTDLYLTLQPKTSTTIPNAASTWNILKSLVLVGPMAQVMRKLP